MAYPSDDMKKPDPRLMAVRRCGVAGSPLGESGRFDGTPRSEAPPSSASRSTFARTPTTVGLMRSTSSSKPTGMAADRKPTAGLYHAYRSLQFEPAGPTSQAAAPIPAIASS